MFDHPAQKSLKRLWVILAGLMLFLLAACQPNGPKISISPAEQDMGTIPQQVVETNYTVRNSGNSPLKITKVYTSCDCTKATLDRMEIPAGETAQLHVRMDPAVLDLYGKIRRDIYLDSNDPRTPEAKVVFRVNIEKP